ncbi:MAG: RHS repeat-associated core domain-containing protein [Desulfosalsimonadaceae bacterium]
MKTGGRYYFYHNDHLGTPQKMTDVSGAVVWSAKSESFGETVVEVATVENNLRFPGQYFDAETGLHYNWFRYYDPNTGRYLRKDPISFLGGDVNLYRYCLGNPIIFYDPKGRAVPLLLRPIYSILSNLFWNTVDRGDDDTADKQKEMDHDTDSDGLNDFFDTDDDNDGLLDNEDKDPKNFDPHLFDPPKNWKPKRGGMNMEPCFD